MRKMLGFFFAVILMLLIFVTIYIQKWNPFQKSIPITVQFARVEGLKKGDDVRVEGVAWGKVGRLQLADDGVIVHMNLDKEITLYEDCEISVEAFTILGGNYISIMRGTPGRPAKDLTKVLKGRTKPGAFDQIGEVLEQNRESIKSLIADADATFKEIKKTAAEVNEGRGSLSLLLKTPDLHDRLVQAVDGVKKSTEDIQAVMGKFGDALNRRDTTMGRIMNTNDIHDAWMLTMEQMQVGTRELVGEINTIVKAFNEGEGPIPHLIHDKEWTDSLKETTENMKKISEDLKQVTEKLAKGEGTIGRLLSEDKLYQEAEKTLEGVDSILGRASRSKLFVMAESKNFPESEETITKIGLKIAPDEKKYFYGGAAFMGLDRDGPITFKKQVEDDEDDTIIKPELYAMYRIPWFLTDYVGVKGGLLEGKFGGGLDVDFEAFHGYPIHLDFEIRDAYRDFEDEKLDENIHGPMARLWAKAPLWPEGDAWYEQFLHAIKVFGGVSRIQDDPEFIVGLGFEYRDEDLKALVGLMSAGSSSVR